MKRWIPWLVLAAGAAADPAGATRGVENYPKVLEYSYGINELPDGEQEMLSWYDVLICMDRPETIASLREDNADQRFLWQLMPQYVDPMPSGGEPWWMPDTLWSIRRLMTVYAHENDWYMKDVGGEPVWDGTHYLLNWTRHCPVGTFGSAKGLRAAEWMASVALPTIALSGRYWDPWSWDSQTAYNGFIFEIFADCLGSYDWSNYEDADPDGDGEAEGVYHGCTSGGDQDPLSLLLREENEVFRDRLWAAFPDDFVFLINENNSYIGPAWIDEFSGMKLENWMREWTPVWHDWWDWFYGLTPPWSQENWGAGYAWAESELGKAVPDDRKGWDVSFIQVWHRSGVAEAENLRQVRWGLGTSMLGDGYFCYTADQRHPLWIDEFDYDFGAPLAGFHRELYGSDTLFVRFFDEGMVEVNPYDRTVNGVASRDSRFSFWLPVEDLSAETEAEHAVRVRWTAPVGEHHQADGYELRYATVPITIEGWDDATPYAGNPVSAPPGSPVSVLVDGLNGGQTYYFATRTRTRGRLEPLLGNQAETMLGEEQDTVPPGTIHGLQVLARGETWLDLSWTATGDDGDWGRATDQFLRFLADDLLEDESDWMRGQQADGLPPPAPPGSAEEFRLEGLEPGTEYGI
ncbi:MAG: hypothetical protein GF346_09745, partial [Candidatus Eisenbacteria bacterium]|nr:hypothetical protein [Candidatus Latescibacterota bacterium]MBD3302716.1 hypothetical protein [Candidatus Eisenbacteria bacterium]